MREFLERLAGPSSEINLVEGVVYLDADVPACLGNEAGGLPSSLPWARVHLVNSFTRDPVRQSSSLRNPGFAERHARHTTRQERADIVVGGMAHQEEGRGQGSVPLLLDVPSPGYEGKQPLPGFGIGELLGR